jgi:hypothetical protein
MPTTAHGLVHPPLDGSTGPDVPADIKALADSIEATVWTAPNWQTLTLTGFQAGANQLKFYKDTTGIVHVHPDTLRTNAASIAAGTLIATMPAGYRPLDTNFGTFIAVSDDSTAGVIPLSISGSNGEIRFHKATPAALTEYTFGLIHYRA